MFFDGIEENIKNVLISFIMKNIAEEPNQIMNFTDLLHISPQKYNQSIFTFIQTISESIILPIAGVVLTYVMTIELIAMIHAHNNMHEHTIREIYWWICKSFAAIFLVSNSFKIVNSIIEIGTYLVLKIAPLGVEFSEYVYTSAEASLSTLSLTELVSVAIGVFVSSWVMKVAIVLVKVFIIARFIEIYLTVSVATIPFATLTSRQLCNTGIHYIKNIFALSFQGILILLTVIICCALSQHLMVSNDYSSADAILNHSLESIVLPLALISIISKSKAITQAIMGAH